MSKGGEKQYWFKAKKYGWGWGLPANRKGWIAFGAFVAVWLVALLWLSFSGGDTEPVSTKNQGIFVGILLLDVLWFVYVSVKYGESPKWRWGGKARAAKSKSD